MPMCGKAKSTITLMRSKIRDYRVNESKQGKLTVKYI